MDVFLDRRGIRPTDRLTMSAASGTIVAARSPAIPPRASCGSARSSLSLVFLYLPRGIASGLDA